MSRACNRGFSAAVQNFNFFRPICQLVNRLNGGSVHATQALLEKPEITVSYYSIEVLLKLLYNLFVQRYHS